MCVDKHQLIMARSMLVMGCLVLVVCLAHQGNGLDDEDWKLKSWMNRLPGFKARLSQRGLDFVKDVGLKVVEEEVLQLKLPTFSGRFKFMLGYINYQTRNMHITKFYTPSTSLTVDPVYGGVKLQVFHLFISVHGDWSWQKTGGIHMSDSGYVDCNLSSISLLLPVRVGADSDGKIDVSSSQCSFNVGQVTVIMHGGKSWIYNLPEFKHKITEMVTDQLKQKVCSTVVTKVNTDLRNKLKQLKMVLPIGNVAEIDYSLVSSPTFKGSINTNHKGEVYPLTGNQTECPLIIPQIPPSFNTTRMVYMWITDYLPNSGCYILQNSGFLDMNITRDNVPPTFGRFLNTSNFALKFVVPLLKEMYPNMAMQINVNTSKPPIVHMNPTGIELEITVAISAYACLPNSTAVRYLFTVDVTIHSSASVALQNNSIVWEVAFVRAAISVARSTVGPFRIFTLSLLQSFIDTVAQLYLVPFINAMGSFGLALPQLKGYELIDPIIILNKGFITIATDVAKAAST